MEQPFRQFVSTYLPTFRLSAISAFVGCSSVFSQQKCARAQGQRHGDGEVNGPRLQLVYNPKQLNPTAKRSRV